MKRAFVALDLPEAARDRLLGAAGALPSGARRVPAEQLHLTLRFLGNLEAAALSALSARLGELVLPAFALTLEQPGTFPEDAAVDPTVLWMGLRAPPALEILRTAVDDAAFAVGVPRDPRPFTPHVTLARLRDVSASALAPTVAALAELGPIELPVTAFALYTSALTHAGATHTRERAYPLRA